MLTFIISIATIATIVAILAYLFFQLDSDVTLWLHEKFGKSPKTLKNKVVWITGASSGIGEGLAYVLSEIGAKLVLSGTNEANLNEVRRKCLTLNSTLKSEDVIIVAFNMMDTDKHSTSFDKVLKHFGQMIRFAFLQIDILVNNAGKSQRSTFEEIDNKVDHELFEINVFGLVNLTRIVLKHWYENNYKGHIVVNSSIAGKLGIPNSATYTGSKHALHGYFECLRLESYFRGIRITMVCPGPVFSNVLKNALTGKPGEVFGVEHKPDSKRMPTRRCADLMTIAIANQLDEVWISDHPILAGFYAIQYFPSLTRLFMTKFMTKEKFSKLRDGN
ncbi:dehydrogenase/reductase SDR family member 7-like protein [Dinothrombium tinctorium]|uniref:Dehydrogenase/reductase SDR family member 7-like protein n=1 Tax=Dinothrombium tinctorium TaxID=1965070 RepID=A0A3S4QEF2_9ACAR|nr:dehydrogenase/reductase SDR family member 7-like protein [Dinothrombium tinctorium]RWS02409.1 dehydrogenase/reductase SDR family member 7-like protein [Dinothrombium tinctorium]RWS06877.1 dehydrogenase/reductase SDR family member 7-like protein [Dinothrombium tinctorium]